ncbi:MAG: M48 family metallopeptidase [Candidatus Wallbacteria bacterium]|nr:M48 family metallopeptidase [Candidatus Wallbacteria bacterium]
MQFNLKEREIKIRELLISYDQNPRDFRRKVLWFSIAGYLYFFLLLLTAASLSAFLLYALLTYKLKAVFFKISIPLLIMIYYMLKSLWVSFSDLPGFELDPELYKLFSREIDEISGKLCCKEIHRILFTHELNACIIQRPILGFFGMYINTLYIGIPLLLCFPHDEFRAILAHELGHISEKHGRTQIWIYRIHHTWECLASSLEQSDWMMNLLIGKFMNWYLPRFSLYSFVLARKFEIKADQLAAEIAGSEVNAHALVRISLLPQFINEDFYSSLWKKVMQQKTLPEYYLMFQESIGRFSNPERQTKYLELLLKSEDHLIEEHPPLQDRIKEISAKIELPKIISQSAAQEYFQSRFSDFISACNYAWNAENGAALEQKIRKFEEHRVRFKELLAKPAAELSASEELYQVLYSREFEGLEAAERRLRDFLTKNPDRTFIQFQLGRVLLEKGDSQGLEVVKKALFRDISLFNNFWAVYHDLQNQGKPEEANEFYKFLQDNEESLNKAKHERNSWQPEEQFLPHALNQNLIEEIAGQISINFPEIISVYLVRKVPKYFPDSPLYLIALVPERRLFRLESDEKDEGLISGISECLFFPYDNRVFMLVAPDGAKHPFLDRITKTENSLIFERPK